MKITVVMHDFNKVGGIINHTEHLICGLREIGHNVTFVKLAPKTTYPKKLDEKEKPTTQGPWERGEGTGLWFNPGKGWQSNYYSMLNEKSTTEFIEFASTQDVLIFQSVFAFASQETEKNLYWTRIFKELPTKVKTIAVIHDGNLKRNYCWLYELQKQFDAFDALACVHPAAMKQTDFLAIPRNMILNPFDLSSLNTSLDKFSSRKDALISPQTFKTMKRVENLIAAIPHMDERIDVVVAGDGIERSYMCSVDKCKEHYFATKKVDPDVSDYCLDKPIWENAIEYGMEYKGFITGEQRDAYLKKFKFLIDSSHSVGYGEHFNRTVFEAMIQGAIPICVNYGVSDNEEGNGTLLKAGVNYLMLKKGMTPKQYAEAVNGFMKISDEESDEIRLNNFKLLEQFDRKKIAAQMIDLAFGKDSGFFKQNEVGGWHKDADAVKKAKVDWDKQFVVEETTSLEDFFG